MLVVKELWKNFIDDSSLKFFCEENENKNLKIFCINLVKNNSDFDMVIKNDNFSFRKISDFEKEDNIYTFYVEEKMKEKFV